MCGIMGVVAGGAVNQLLYDGLLVLQHRGQDAAGDAHRCNGAARPEHEGKQADQERRHADGHPPLWLV